MATRSAGTLVTAHSSAYIAPALMPGYRGHVPTLKFDYGETYGHESRKHFQDYRSECLSKSAFPLSRGGEFPTNYTHSPALVISNRSRTRDRWQSQAQYEHLNYHRDRTMELRGFNKESQQHREHYNDKTGTIKRVDSFIEPVTAQDQFAEHLPFMILSTRHTDMVHLPNLGNLPSQPAFIPHYSRSIDKRERAIRDVFFERR